MRRWRKKMSKRSGRLSYCEDFLSRCSQTDRMSCRSSASLDPPSSHLRHLSCVCSQTASPWTWALNKRQTGGIILHLCETRGSDRFILDRSSCSWVPSQTFETFSVSQTKASCCSDVKERDKNTCTVTQHTQLSVNMLDC